MEEETHSSWVCMDHEHNQWSWNKEKWITWNNWTTLNEIIIDGKERGSILYKELNENNDFK